ncbi:MAG: hypothetical protein Q9207_003313 [Kuettlingeria erythrocarpa]
MGPLSQITNSWLTLHMWTLLFVLCSSVSLRASALTLAEPKYISLNPPTLVINETGQGLGATNGETPKPPKYPRSFGIRLYPRDVMILPQAVGGILTEAMYKAYRELGTQPLTASNGFQHDYSEMIEEKICFDVGINMSVNANLTGEYTMTNTRVVTVLSLMGFDFAHHEDMSSLREYNFEIFVDDTIRGETVLGHGSLVNQNPALRPVFSNNRLLWPRCKGNAAFSQSRRSVQY